MRRADLRSAAGGLALVGMLLLASPGVRVVHADGVSPSGADRGTRAAGEAPYRAKPESGASCQVNPQPVLRLDARRLQVLREELAAQAASDSAADVRVLNGRGVRYGSSPLAVDPRLLRFEQRQRP